MNERDVKDFLECVSEMRRLQKDFQNRARTGVARGVLLAEMRDLERRVDKWLAMFVLYANPTLF